MHLTAEQKNRIAAFLRKQDEQFSGLPAAARVQALGEVKKRIRREIAFLGQETVSDDQIESILGRMKVTLRPSEKHESPETEPDGPMAEVSLEPVSEADPGLQVKAPTWDASEAEAEPVVEPEPQSESTTRDASSDSDDEPDDGPADYGDRHWLGVCAAVADRRRMPVSTLRIGFIVLGLVTGPIALVAYCIAYFADSYQHPNEYPEGDGWAASWRMVRALVIALALYFGAWLVLYGAGELYATFIGGLAELEQFGAVMEHDRRALVFVLFTALPLALLSGLPMAYRWDRTMELLVNAVLAVYAVLLSLGVSSSLAGYLLSAFQHFRG